MISPRRRFLSLSLGACLLNGLREAAACVPAGQGEKFLPATGQGLLPRITRPEAQESGRAVYWADGALQPDGYRIINRLYRDLHADLEQPIAIALLDLNHALQSAVAQVASPRPLILLSGFRTAATNRLVGGVEPSAHETGRADDFIFEGLSFTENIALAQRFQFGGLGIYPDRGSLHKDLGPFRTWVEYGRPLPPPAPIRINPESAPSRTAPLHSAPSTSNPLGGSR
jgi:uncharacterized protein YcbK (DUF882 family)